MREREKHCNCIRSQCVAGFQNVTDLTLFICAKEIDRLGKTLRQFGGTCSGIQKGIYWGKFATFMCNLALFDKTIGLQNQPFWSVQSNQCAKVLLLLLLVKDIWHFATVMGWKCKWSKYSSGSPPHPNEANYLPCTPDLFRLLWQSSLFSLFFKGFSLIPKKWQQMDSGYSLGCPYICLGLVDTEHRKTLSCFVINSRTVYHISWH